MSNEVFKLLVVAVLGLHAGALALGVSRRWGAAVPGLVWAEAAAVLAWMAFHPRAFGPPVDGAVVGLAGFEALVLMVATMSLRRIGFARAGVWIAFALHTAVSGLAVAYAFLFKIDRLI